MTTNRLEAFSDGVLAIATTLLVIEIHPPEIHQGKTLAHALWAQWPGYLAYMVSFLTTRLRFMAGTGTTSAYGRAELGRLVRGQPELRVTMSRTGACWQAIGRTVFVDRRATSRPRHGRW